jgi:quinol-cytochrome oxidoreductase complex cytochrome b subunit
MIAGWLAKTCPAGGVLLLGSDLLDAGIPLGRVAGVALLSLGVACWLARYDAKSNAARWLVGAMFIYNLCTTVILGVAGIWSRPIGIGLWPAVVLHAAMTLWCVACLAAQAPIYDEDDRRAS